MGNLDRSAVDKFRNEPWPWEKGVEGQAAVAGLPPGYIVGFYPSIDNGALTIGAGTAFIFGQRVDTDSHLIVESDFVTNRLGSFTYYVYLDNNRIYTVDTVVPEYSEDYRYYAHPITGTRYIIGFTTDASKDVDGYVLTIPTSGGIVAAGTVGAEQIEAGSITADAIAADAITADKIAADNFFFTKAVGSQNQDTPSSGDVRSYLGKDPAGAQSTSDPVGISIEEYNGDNWEERFKAAMRSGGNVADAFVSGDFRAGERITSTIGRVYSLRKDVSGDVASAGAALLAFNDDAIIIANNQAGNAGIWVSSDDAQTWAFTDLSSQMDGISSIAFNNGNFVIAGIDTGSTYRYFYSSNNGSSWTNGQVTASSTYNIILGQKTSSRLLSAAQITGANPEYSTDGGVNWSTATTLPYDISIHAVDGDVFVISDQANSQIWVTTDAGATWSSSRSTPVGFDFLCIANNALIGHDSGDTDIYRSMDWGATWSSAITVNGSEILFTNIAFVQGILTTATGNVSNVTTTVTSSDLGRTWRAT